MKLDKIKKQTRLKHRCQTSINAELEENTSITVVSILDALNNHFDRVFDNEY